MMYIEANKRLIGQGTVLASHRGGEITTYVIGISYSVGGRHLLKSQMGKKNKDRGFFRGEGGGPSVFQEDPQNKGRSMV